MIYSYNYFPFDDRLKTPAIITEVRRGAVVGSKDHDLVVSRIRFRLIKKDGGTLSLYNSSKQE